MAKYDGENIVKRSSISGSQTLLARMKQVYGQGCSWTFNTYRQISIAPANVAPKHCPKWVLKIYFTAKIPKAVCFQAGQFIVIYLKKTPKKTPFSFTCLFFIRLCPSLCCFQLSLQFLSLYFHLSLMWSNKHSLSLPSFISLLLILFRLRF